MRVLNAYLSHKSDSWSILKQYAIESVYIIYKWFKFLRFLPLAEAGGPIAKPVSK